MNIYLYSKNKRHRVSWTSTSNDFNLLGSRLGQEQLLYKISDSLILLSANDRTRNRIAEYCMENDQVSKFNSRKISAFISKLSDNECFFILNADVCDDYERLSAIQTLDNAYDVYNRESFFNGAHEQLLAYAEISSKYNVYAYGIDETSVYVGELDKSKRICRFCRKPKKDYKNVAHAIPEALGNTKLFCNEECDSCNHELNVIEDNFITLMDVRRAMFRIKRKGTSDVPNIDGQNFVIRGDIKGNPLIYYMEDALPNGWQNIDVIPIRLNLKYKTTNENIYKALCKMAIDLMPSEYVSQFSETVDWISSNGRFIPDHLPSCYIAMLPEGIFYGQPQLHLYIKNDIELDLPFCFALLNIYDVCYRFIVPFSKPDAGKYRTNDSLAPFWYMFQTKPELTWYEQNTSEWWLSAPWVEFDIRSDAPFLVVKPSKDPIFENCGETNNPEEWVYKGFNINKIDIGIDKLTCKYSHKVKILTEQLHDTTVEFERPLYSFYENEKILQLKFSLRARIANSTKPFLSIEIRAYVSLDKFTDQIKYDHFVVNADFTHAVWDKLMAEVSRQISNRLKYTQFSRLNPFKDFNALNHRFMRETLYDFYTSDGNYIRMPYKCAHEEMSESKRIKIFRQANNFIGNSADLN